MHPQLAALADQLTAVAAKARDMASACDDNAFHKRPPSGGWSAAECIAHLNITTNEYLPLLDQLLASGRPGFPDTRRYRRGFLAALFAWSLEPPARMRIRTIPRFVPNSTGSKQEIMDEWVRTHGEFQDRLQRASGIHLEELRITSPFNAKMSYNVYAGFCILAAHERRHVWQAERAIQGRP
jgi:hypothetical protein